MGGSGDSSGVHRGFEGCVSLGALPRPPWINRVVWWHPFHSWPTLSAENSQLHRHPAPSLGGCLGLPTSLSFLSAREEWLSIPFLKAFSSFPVLIYSGRKELTVASSDATAATSSPPPYPFIPAFGEQSQHRPNCEPFINTEPDCGLSIIPFHTLREVFKPLVPTRLKLG